MFPLPLSQNSVGLWGAENVCQASNSIQSIQADEDLCRLYFVPSLVLEYSDAAMSYHEWQGCLSLQVANTCIGDINTGGRFSLPLSAGPWDHVVLEENDLEALHSGGWDCRILKGLLLAQWVGDEILPAHQVSSASLIWVRIYFMAQVLELHYYHPANIFPSPELMIERQSVIGRNRVALSILGSFFHQDWGLTDWPSNETTLWKTGFDSVFKILRIPERAQSFSCHQCPNQGMLQISQVSMSPRPPVTIWKLIMALGLGPQTAGCPGDVQCANFLSFCSHSTNRLGGDLAWRDGRSSRSEKGEGRQWGIVEGT